MKDEEAIKFLYYIADELQEKLDIRAPKGNWTAQKRIEAIAVAISAIHAKQELLSNSKALKSSDLFAGTGGEIIPISESNAPLTLDELRKMDGEPVWVQFLHNKVGYWDIIGCRNSEFLRFYRSGFLVIGEYGKNFLAYRQKPGEAFWV